MKIEPIAQPALVQPTGAKTEYAVDARTRAINALMQGAPQAQEHAVKNPSQVTPEEISAIRGTSEQGQPNHSESEVAAETPKEEPKVSEEPLSSHYANLARKEKALRARAQAQEAAIKAKEAEIAAREEAIKAKDAEYSSKYIAKDRLTTDTLNALLDAGLSYEQITEAMLNQQAQPDFTKSRAYLEMQAELKAVKEAQEQAKKSYEEQQTQAYQQALGQIRSDVSKLVYTDPNFETIKATNSINDVVELIERTFKEEGSLLSVEEASQMVEDHLVEEALSIARLKKIQSRLQPKETAPQATPKTADAPKQQQLKTLSNSVSSSRQLSAKERAILAFKGELKS